MAGQVEIVRKFRIEHRGAVIELDPEEALELYAALAAFLEPEHETVLFTGCAMPVEDEPPN